MFFKENALIFIPFLFCIVFLNKKNNSLKAGLISILTFCFLIFLSGCMKMKQVIDVIISRSIKQGIDANAFDFSKDAYPSGKVVKKEVPVRNGLKQEDARKIVKLIKDSGLKVQAQIMDDMVRVIGKKIDDLQEVIAKCRAANLGIPLQFVNMKS